MITEHHKDGASIFLGETRHGEPFGYGMDLEPADIIRLRDYLTGIIDRG